MKKILFIIILAVLAVFLINNNREENPSEDMTSGELIVVEENMDDEDEENTEEENMGNELSGEASYTAQKVFFEQPTAAITGSTGDLSGDINYEDGMLIAQVDVATENLVTGNATRDGEVQELLGSTVQARITETELELPFSGELPVEVTIAGTTNTIPFTMEIIENENELTLEGTGNIFLSSFNLEPFGAPGIYSVEDEIELSIQVTEA